jgi:hypothetical protein
MISYDQTSSRSKLAAMALAVVAMAGAVTWWGMREAEPQAPAEAAASAPGAQASASDPEHQSQIKKAADALLTKPEILPDGRPTDFEAEEWKTLKDAVATTPNSTAELQRISTYMRFQRGFEQWQSLHDSPDIETRNALGQKLMGALPERLTNQEVTFDEALMICAALANDLAPTEPRQQQMEQCNTKLAQVAPRLDDDTAARQNQCQVRWNREKSQMTDEFLKLPELQRDQRAFDAKLEKLRVSIFDSPECTGKSN